MYHFLHKSSFQEDSIVDATEDDQLQAAIKASLTEVTAPSKSDLSVSDSGSDSELETFSDSDEELKPSPVKTRRLSGSENTLRKTKGSPNTNSPNRTEKPSTSNIDKRASPLRKEKSSSPAPKIETDSPVRRKGTRNSPFRTDGSDSGENSSSITPKKVCSSRKSGSPLNKSSPAGKGSPNIKSSGSPSAKNSPQRNSPLRKVPAQKAESIHNVVHPAVVDNIKRSLDSSNGVLDTKESSAVNKTDESLSSSSDITDKDSSNLDESMEIVSDINAMDYLNYLGNEKGKL